MPARNHLMQDAATFKYTKASKIAIVQATTVEQGGNMKSTSTLSTTGEMTNAGNYSRISIDGSFTYNADIDVVRD